MTIRSRRKWIIDFGEMAEGEAALFEAPFEYLRAHEKKHREGVRNELERTRWWQHGRVARDMRKAIERLGKFIATPRHSKHRMFSWVDSQVVPDSALVVFARQDDYFLGILHSRVREFGQEQRVRRSVKLRAGSVTHLKHASTPIPSLGRPAPNPPRRNPPSSAPSQTPHANLFACATPG